MRICPTCGRQFKRYLGAHVWRCKVSDEDLFWSLVEKAAPDACWPWKGAKHRDGYGRANVKLDGKRSIRIAHRIAWLFTHGEIPAGMDVCHTCDNPACCNPAHLWLGSHDENMADARAKLRHTHGEKNKHAKLTAEQVGEIRKRFKFYSRRKTNADELAPEYGVQGNAIYLAATGRTWKYVPVPACKCEGDQGG